MKTIEFERKAEETTIIEIDIGSEGIAELTLTVKELTASRVKLALTGEGIKRVMKEDPPVAKP